MLIDKKLFEAVIVPVIFFDSRDGGVYLFRKAVLAGLVREGPCSIEYDLFPKLIEKGAKLFVVEVADAPFIDIGTPETLVEAESFVRTHFGAMGD